MEINKDDRLLLELWLEDQSFINWAMRSNDNDMANWELYFNQNPDHWELGKAGRILVQGIPFNEIPKESTQTKVALERLMNRLGRKEEENERTLIPLRSSFQNTWKWAATLALVLLISGMTYFQFFHHKEVLISTNYGEQREYVLPDGSKVTLNANSYLSYYSQNPRKVTLEGEAFFEIKKIPETQTPFQVYTQDLMVTVLGTSFNVNARNDQTKVFLEEGKVDLEVHDPETGVIQMNPGDLVTYSKKQNKLKENRSNASALENASWKAGTLVFNNTPLQEALYEIEDIYGIQFIIQSEKVKDEVISGGVPIKDLEVSLQTLSEVYGIHIRSKGKRYFITGKQE